MISNGTPISNAQAELHDLISGIDERVLRERNFAKSGMDVRWGTYHRVGDLLELDKADGTYKIRLPHIENGAVVGKFHSIRDGLKLVLSDDNPIPKAQQFKEQQQANEVTAREARQAAERAPLERMEAWTNLHPVVRAFFQLAAAQPDPEQVEMWNGLARGIQSEIDRPSVPPATWGV